jgi:hypothetical protein
MEVESLNEKYVVLNDIIQIDTFNYDYFHFIALYEKIPNLKKEYKLPSYNNKQCVDINHKQSETVYNNEVFETNPHKYILLDRNCIQGCEVADLYDKDNKLLFHNKKWGDLRVLSLQIIIGALIMKNKDKHAEYMKYLKTKGIYDIIDHNFKYVIGVIGNKTKIAQKDKLSLGIVNFILTQHKIELYLDNIDTVA